MTKDPEELLSRYNAGLCTDAEKAMVEQWYLKLSAEEAAHLDRTSALRNQGAAWQALSANRTRKRKLRLKFTAAAAAAVLLVGSIAGLYHWPSGPVKPAAALQAGVSHILPGGNKAFLTLADGRKISLTDAASGEIAQQEGLSIHKTTEGQLVYTPSGPHSRTSAAAFNTIETPKGGQYQVNLPDGTKVWLNASSSLRYPTRFDKDRRVVQLSGEGYFEVAKRKVKFLVQTGGQEVEVLGTHFNIDSYADEDDIRTTLLEGSVRIHLAKGKEKISRLLRPGEQSLVTTAGIRVREADPETVMAWKNGDFVFKKEDLKSIMNKIARWYDVEVVYKGNLDQLKFGGYMSRNKSITAVLKVMESTGKVKFDIAGKKIIVSRP